VAIKIYTGLGGYYRLSSNNSYQDDNNRQMTKAIIIDGNAIAREFYEILIDKVRLLKSRYNLIPGLGLILIGNDPASHIYVRNKIKKAQEIGINNFDYIMPENTSSRILNSKIRNLNNDQRINGILLQLPLPEHLDQNEAINEVDPSKDVDGFTVKNIGLLNSWQECLEPSTPQGILHIIKKIFGDDLSGKKVVILGRSLIVGRPLSTILIRESCTVTLLHSKSVNIKSECNTADILVSAVGSPGFIKSDLIKPGACVIDVGITRVDDKIYGDIDFQNVKEVAGFVTPVPGGIGPMTIACMLQNTVKAMCNQKKIII
jgi:methylenetetrahydrofolate dehydrogenase (NADP+) / methenyltetrahydrofolate cyclohydrolase